MPHCNSNLNKKKFSNVVIGQFLCYFKICSLRKNASKHCFLLIARLFYHRNYPMNFLNYYDRTLKNSYISYFIFVCGNTFSLKAQDRDWG